MGKNKNAAFAFINDGRSNRAGAIDITPVEETSVWRFLLWDENTQQWEFQKSGTIDNNADTKAALKKLLADIGSSTAPSCLQDWNLSGIHKMSHDEARMAISSFSCRKPRYFSNGEEGTSLPS